VATSEQSSAFLANSTNWVVRAQRCELPKATPRASPLETSAQGGNRSARRRCSFRRKREEEIG